MKYINDLFVVEIFFKNLFLAEEEANLKHHSTERCTVIEAAQFMAALVAHAHETSSHHENFPIPQVTKTKKFATKVLTLLSGRIFRFLLQDANSVGEDTKREPTASGATTGETLRVVCHLTR